MWCAAPCAFLNLKEVRHVKAFATVKRFISSIPQHELIDPDVFLSIANSCYQALLTEKAIEILTMFFGTINRSWDKENRAAAYLAEYEKADSFLYKALAITDDPESKVMVMCQMGYMSNFSCNYDDALAALNQALEIISAESGERREKSKRWSKHTALVHAQIGDVLSERGGA